MKTINPYLNFDGRAEEAFGFYQSIFGGEFAGLMRWKEMPENEACQQFDLSEEDGDKILHIALPIGGGNLLMASDSVGPMRGQATAGSNFSISIDAETREETERLFEGLASEGTVLMPLADTFWGSYFGMCADRFGVQWMVSCPQAAQ